MKWKIFLLFSILPAVLVGCSSGDEPKPDVAPDIQGAMSNVQFQKYVEGTVWTNEDWKVALPDGTTTEVEPFCGHDPYNTIAFNCTGGKFTRYLYEQNRRPYHASTPYGQFTYNADYNPSTGEISLTNPNDGKSAVWFRVEYLQNNVLALEYVIGNIFAGGKGHVRLYFRPATAEEIEKYRSWDDTGRDF